MSDKTELLLFADFCLQIGNLRISSSVISSEIMIVRDGEGGNFSLKEFHDLIQEFVNERL